MPATSLPPQATSAGLPPKEFLLIQEISRRPETNQRTLSESTGMSVGMTNLLIRRLTRKGLIKVNQLDWKRAQYVLTIDGVLALARKSYNYTLYTMRILGQLRENIVTALRREHAAGERAFAVVAQDEIRTLIEETVKGMNLKGARFTYYAAYEDVPANARLVLTAVPQPPPPIFPPVLKLVDFENLDFRVAGRPAA